MKTKLLVLVLAIAFSISCKKDAGLKPDKPSSSNLFAVNFKLTGFTVETKGMSVKGTGATLNGLKDQIKFLTYFVYKGSPDSLKLVKKIEQKSIDASFGKITDSLPAGKYKVFFVGSTSSGYRTGQNILSYVDWSYHPSLGFNTSSYSGYYGYTSSMGDTFLQQVDLDVQSAVNKNILLKRITSKITFKIQDAMPENVGKIVVSIGNAVPEFDMFSESAAYNTSHGYDFDDRVLPFNVKATDQGKANLTFSAFIWPHSPYYPYFLDVYDKNNKLIKHKSLEVDSQIYALNAVANTEYIFSGYLFDSSQPAGFSVKVDDKWNAPETIPFDDQLKQPIL
ncbi:hypothetical protein GS399_06775 [Pedobacter sp. HMF7647]|uniref:Uncharacterized protein n=1 Tax=Hufsiella arboris TaxID=2695275 RepID=A0A7K1Y7W3_9SPHI|nr:FimB/Mfa2 family fimbrial subunit [Hufsiella arboris]MXV50672.1 hypothetical protein [Hufsiella arboris]